MTADTCAVVAVYDAREPPWCLARLIEVGAWLETLEVEPADVHRVEIYLLDCLFARVYQDGVDPVDIPVAAAPPVWGGA